MSQHPAQDAIMQHILASLPQLQGEQDQDRFDEEDKLLQQLLGGQEDIGLERSEVGDTPGILDPVGIDNQLLQALLDVGSEFRFGMGGGEKFARTVQGQGIPGFGEERQSVGPGGELGGTTTAPASGDIDQAQRALSVALGSERFGPLLPTIMSLLSVDNPSAANPQSAQATRDALAAVQGGTFEGAPGNEGFNQAISTVPILGQLLGQSEGSFDLANLLLETFGAEQPGDIGNQPFEPGPQPIQEMGGGIESLLGTLSELFGVQGSQAGEAASAGPPKHLSESLAKGRLKEGNIDLFNRPDVDGSTIRSISFNQDGKEILIPTVVGNEILSDEDAIQEFFRSGQNLGTFDSPESATAFGQAISDDFASGRIPTPDRGGTQGFLDTLSQLFGVQGSRAGQAPKRTQTSTSPRG